MIDASGPTEDAYQQRAHGPRERQAIMGAPLLWWGALPVLGYNLLVLAGLALTGWTTSLVVERWTGNRLAGILRGSLMAFNALSLTRFPELQDQHLT